MFRQIAAAAVLLTAAPSAGLACVPDGMAKIVTRWVTPGIDPKSMGAQQKTSYRLTLRQARIEEPRNPVTGVQGMMVVNEPDIWIVDRAKNTGQHAIDPGPVLEIHAPLFSWRDTPPAFQTLELGCEKAFLDAYAPKPQGEAVVDGLRLARHQVSVGQDRIEILMRTDGRPYTAAYYKGEVTRLVIRYDEYLTGLPADMSLFSKPSGVVFTEAPTPTN